MAILKDTTINGTLTLTGNGYITLPKKSLSWLQGFQQSPIQVSDATDNDGYHPWIIQKNTSSAKMFTMGVYQSYFVMAGSATSRTSNGYDNALFFNVTNGELKLNNFYLYLHSNNYNNYAPTKSGGGAHGTWGINISGNAASLSKVLSIDKGGTGHSSMQSGCILVKGSGIGTFPCLKANNSTYGIETTTAQAKIGVWNNYNTVELATNQNAGIYCDAKTFTDGETNPPDSIYGKESRWLIYINTSGTVTKNTSDRRRKLYIKDMSENETKVLLNVPIRNFVFKEDIGHNDLEQNGVFAQDLRELLKKNNIGNRPYLQWEYNDNDRDDVYYDINAPEKDDMTYSVSYNHMIPALIKGWQMQNKEIEELEKKLAILRIKKLGK